MKKKLLIIIYILVQSVISHAQIQLEYRTPSTGSYGEIRITDPSLMSRPVNQIDYTDITGSPFWNTEWKTATLFTSTNKVFVEKVKLNLYTSEIHYINTTGKEFSIDAGVIKKVVFYKSSDTTTKLAEFIFVKAMDDNKMHYLQELNKGETQLYKLSSVSLLKKDYNPIEGKTPYGFTYQHEYYLYYDGVITKLKGLKKKNLFDVMPSGSSTETWLNTNNNKLNNESDFISFLDYYNTIPAEQK